MPPRTLRYKVRVLQREVVVTVEQASDGSHVVTSDAAAFDGVTVRASGPTLSVLVGNRMVELAPGVDGAWVALAGGTTIEVEPERRRGTVRSATTGSPGSVQAPMPGRVLKVLVAEGERVETGTGLVVIEAMKMENEIAAPCAGSVRRVLVQAGDAVERDALLVELA